MHIFMACSHQHGAQLNEAYLECQNCMKYSRFLSSLWLKGTRCIFYSCDVFCLIQPPFPSSLHKSQFMTKCHKKDTQSVAATKFCIQCVPIRIVFTMSEDLNSRFRVKEMNAEILPNILHFKMDYEMCLKIRQFILSGRIEKLS